jgi:hypothetical protein
VSSPVLTRWRTRCQAAVETGAGLPLRGWWLWREPDWSFVQGITWAVVETSAAADPAVASATMATLDPSGQVMLAGLLLADRWLDEERAAECFRANAEASK